MLGRPQNLQEIANVATDFETTGLAFAELLDEVRKLSPQQVAAVVEAEPPTLAGRFPEGPVCDAFAAALADYLCELAQLPEPTWAKQSSRFLAKDWFPVEGLSRSHPLGRLLVAGAPAAFRERRLFLDVRSLSRT